METGVRLVRLVQIAMLVSIVLYVAVGELVGRAAAANNALFYTMSLACLLYTSDAADE